MNSILLAHKCTMMPPLGEGGISRSSVLDTKLQQQQNPSSFQSLGYGRGGLVIDLTLGNICIKCLLSKYN